MPSITTEALEIAYDVSGAGPVVLLLHGWPDAVRGLRPLRDHLDSSGWQTVAPDLRGCGQTRFRDASTTRDGQAAALTRDAIDLLDALGLDQVHVVGHDWGARVAYHLAALVPERVSSVTALALAFQPLAQFSMPDFDQARAFWYQWLMSVDAGAEAVRRDPVGFARIQWDTWSPPGWFDEKEFAATAESFTHPDWAEITLNAYCARFVPAEPRDRRYDDLRDRMASVATIDVPTLMIQGGSDLCDLPASSSGLDDHFTAGYRREVLEGVGHFPHREAPEIVAAMVEAHLAG
jgi:pimeloyl-ACP methyl ester carboxylesterase